MKRRSLLGNLLVWGLLLVGFDAVAPAWADEPLPDASVLATRGHRHKPQQPKISDVTLTGTITGVQSSGLLIKASKSSRSKNQKQWLVLAQSDSTQFTIHGTAMPEYLRAGQLVEFNARIVAAESADGKPKEEKTAEPLEELTIIARKAGAASNKGGKDYAINPGIGGRIETPKPQANSETAVEPPDDSPQPSTSSGDAPSGPKTKITGRIAAIKDRKFTVTCGERTIQAELSLIPTINVEISGPKLVPDSKDRTKLKIEGPGSSGRLVPVLGSELIDAKIVVQGRAAVTKSWRRCSARSIDVTLASPLAGNKPAAAETAAAK
jgi:hypothetical protein